MYLLTHVMAPRVPVYEQNERHRRVVLIHTRAPLVRAYEHNETSMCPINSY